MIVIPSLLKEKLEKSNKLYSEVMATISEFTPWFTDNKLVFFPDYTDHGVEHIQDVLNTASSLITDSSWDVISPQDAAAVVISILLHDCAMHLSEDGFYCLINNVYPSCNSRYLDLNINWNEEWLMFIAEAKRWDGKKLSSIFGDAIPINNVPNTKNDLTRRHRLLIGEFLRIKHSTLAHCIAINGIPGVDDNRIKISISDEKLADLFGFIARSHNLPLRIATDALSRSQKRTLYDVHAPFIMGILRVSDYFQVHSSRAKKELLSIKSLSSPISQLEWKKHHSIIDINQTHEDPEAIYIDAEPDSPTVFKQLTELFQNIQWELDSTWSILGEIYGRYESLNILGINIRRIRSSLDDVSIYVQEKKPDFIPLPVKFKTSDAEMMSLLVAPLYGDDASIGIRELVQNAVDACNERNDYMEKMRIQPTDTSEATVTVKITKTGDDQPILSVTDTGIGMKKDIIENYFLNIGASFRNSDLWKTMHETDGHSNVHRTGRFGVGILAAFLLGPEITIRTRHLNENQGLTFTCTQGSDEISLFPCECDVGTQIIIPLFPDAYDELKSYNDKRWDWFCLSNPKVTRILNVNEKEKVLTQHNIVPNSGDDISNSIWRRINHDDFDDILWTEAKLTDSRWGHSVLICNGIIFKHNAYTHALDVDSHPIDIELITPSVVVFDQDGKLPINLTRSGLISKRLPFNNELLLDLCKEVTFEIYNKYYLNNQNITIELVREMTNPDIKLLSKSDYGLKSHIAKLFLRNGRVYPCCYDLISELKPKAIAIDPVSDVDDISSHECNELINNVDIYLPYNLKRRSRSSKVDFLRAYLDHDNYFSSFPTLGKILIIKTDDLKNILSPGYFPKTQWAKFKKLWSENEWGAYAIGDTSTANLDYKKIRSHLSMVSQSMLVIILFDWEKEPVDRKPSILYLEWNKLAPLQND